MSLRRIGAIIEELKMIGDDRVKQLTNELSNAQGAVVGSVRNEIMEKALNRAVSQDGTDEKYISIDVLEDIIRSAGSEL